MKVVAGTMIGAYEIVDALGAGGMGEVWRARDTKLGRVVALKFLSPPFASDPDRLARFGREARVLAALNHPNIASIYGFEDASDAHALVLELVDGPTLADLIAHRPIPVDEAFRIARQIVEALDAAHGQGIVHRDLKPANIKVTPNGVVKILDFGIAKTIAPAADPLLSSMSPTLTVQGTYAGTLLGTAAYMSPEQARGGPVDRRADIWAFGCVFHEMLTGTRLFAGDTVSDTLAAVLRADPTFDGIPARAERLLRSCLQKDPNRRLRDIGDADLLMTAVDPIEGHTTSTSPVRSRVAWAVAAGFAALAVLLAFVHLREQPLVLAPVSFQLLPPDKVSYTGGFFVLSPDGSRIAFSGVGMDGRNHLWIRTMSVLEPKLVRGSEGGTSPFWSPDGKWVGFVAGGQLKRVDVNGGTPQMVADRVGNRGNSWSESGVILLGADRIYKVPAAGGALVPVTTLDPARRETFHARPFFLPDGRHFLFVRASAVPDMTGIYVGSIDDPPGQPGKRVMGGSIGPMFVPTPGTKVGRLFFLRDRQLMVQPFDTDRLELGGDPVLVAEPVGDNGNAIGYFSVSPTGVLAYRGGTEETRLTWFDRHGTVIGEPGDPARYDEVELSPDGRRVAAPRYGANHDIWLVELARGVSTRLTFDPSWDNHPVWSPDGNQIVFASNRTDPRDLFRKLSSGAQDEERVLATDKPKTPLDWSRDGRFLLYSEVNGAQGEDLWLLEHPGGAPAERKTIPFLATPFRESEGKFSPDTQWIAYTSDESGRSEVYVRAFQGTGAGAEKWIISVGGGSQPRWRADGKEIFYVAPDRRIMVVGLKPLPSFNASVPQPLFTAPVVGGVGNVTSERLWDVSGDGQRFLVAVAPDAGRSPLSVVLNWRAGVSR
jgi:Tol biopolymer transport system component